MSSTPTRHLRWLWSVIASIIILCAVLNTGMPPVVAQSAENANRTAATGSADPTPQALAALDRSFPKVKWERAGALAADVTGDAISDVIVPGKNSEKFVVGIVEGPVSAGSRAWSLAFNIGKQTQDSLCGTLVRLSTENPRLPLAEWGCSVNAQSDRCTDHKAADEWLRAHSSAQGIRVDDGMCDSFHIYWDSAKSIFNWWRL